MTTLALHPSKFGQVVLVVLGSFCVAALASSQVDWRVGVLLIFLIYGAIAAEWRRMRHTHPRAVIKLIQQGAREWVLCDREGRQVTLRWLPSSVVTRYLCILHGQERQGRRHCLLLFFDNLSPSEWRQLVVALRLRMRMAKLRPL